jgi:hypothetical protein
LFKKSNIVLKTDRVKNIEAVDLILLQKFRALLSKKKSSKNARAGSRIAAPKFQTPCFLIKIRKKFPSVMVYVMISPNYDVNTCQRADMTYIKKGKVPETGERKFFHRYVL